MVETQTLKRQEFSGVKEAVKRRRSVKDLSHEEGISLSGIKGWGLTEVLNRADLVLSQLREEYRDWVTQKLKLLAGYLSGVKPDIVDETYEAGLHTTITQEFRTVSRDSREEASELDSPEYLKGVIIGYTVDFFRSLRLSQRLGVNPNTALAVARLSYHYNPTKLTQLVKRYPEINPGVINSAALGYPKNPETFLDGFIANVARLAEDSRYKALNPGVINSAALGYPKNPEAFLDGFIANVARLAEDPRYAELAQSIIDRAALGYPKNPEAYIKKVRAGKALAEISEVELGVVLPEEEILTPDQPTIGQ